MVLRLFFAYLLCVATTHASSPDPIPEITINSVRAYVGKQARVCGDVDFVRDRSSQSGAYFVNFGTNFNHDPTRPWWASAFTAVFWERDTARMEINPSSEFSGMHVCFEGTVVLYQNSPQITVRNGSQYQVIAPVNAPE